MSYFKTAAEAIDKSHFQVLVKCMCCGKDAKGPTFAYDLELPSSTLLTRALFHRDCAFAMAQRVIVDSWPNRRDGEFMKNDR